jgi:hypothetical protein
MKEHPQRNAVRVLNPTPPKKRKGQHLVYVVNPGASNALLRAAGSSGAARVFEEFRGRKAQRVSTMVAAPGTPETVAELGGLCELSIDPETTNRRVIKALGLPMSKDENGDDALAFKPGRVKLVSDSEGDLHLTGFYMPLPQGLSGGKSYYLGRVVNVVYKADKVHLEGDHEAREYTHEFCEDFGEDYPALYYRDGYLYFRGGSYTVTQAGLIN